MKSHPSKPGLTLLARRFQEFDEFLFRDRQVIAESPDGRASRYTGMTSACAVKRHGQTMRRISENLERTMKLLTDDLCLGAIRTSVRYPPTRLSEELTQVITALIPKTAAGYSLRRSFRILRALRFP